MPDSSKVRILTLPAIAAVVVVLAAAPARSQTTPSGDGGRYKFSPTSDGGVLRLDTRTGSVSNCAKRDSAGWACYVVPDERDALDAEIGRLQAENTHLKDELKKRDLADAGNKIDAPTPNGSLAKNNNPDMGKTDAGKGNRLELQLPSDQDIDRMVGLLERAWRRLVDAANRMQRDVQGKI
jgi:hypothetical protein